MIPFIVHIRVVGSLQKFGKKWLSLNTWVSIAQDIWDYLTSDTGECIAVEVLKYRSSAGHFAQSIVPRNDRPEQVKYHVGQVFQHKLQKYHGVIIGWDEQAKVSLTLVFCCNCPSLVISLYQQH